MWKKATIKMVDGRQYIGANIWLEEGKRTSDMLNSEGGFLSIVWDDDFYCINKQQIFWVNEHTGIKDNNC